jgi:hypothetical protein
VRCPGASSRLYTHGSTAEVAEPNLAASVPLALDTDERKLLPVVQVEAPTAPALGEMLRLVAEHGICPLLAEAELPS